MLNALRRQDGVLYVALGILMAASLLAISSARPALFWLQLTWFAAALAVMVALASVDIRPALNYRWILFGAYLAVVALLIAALLFAPTIRNTRSWISLGFIMFQPAELAKVAVIILF